MSNYGQPNKAQGAVISDANNTIDDILVTNSNDDQLISLYDKLKELSNQGANYNAKGVCLTDYPNLTPTTNLFDGYIASAGDTILLNSPTNKINNGLYIFHGASVPFTRSDKMPVGDQISGSTVSLETSTTYGNGAILFCDSPFPAIVGTNELSFVDKAVANIESSNSVQAVFNPATDTVKLLTTDENADADGYFASYMNNKNPKLESISYTTNNPMFFGEAGDGTKHITGIINKAQLSQNCQIQLLGNADAPLVTTVVPSTADTGQVMNGIDTNGFPKFVNNYFSLPVNIVTSDTLMVNNQPISCNANNLNITLPSASNARDGYFYSVRNDANSYNCLIYQGTDTVINYQLAPLDYIKLNGLFSCIIFQYYKTGATTGRYDIISGLPKLSSFVPPDSPYQMTSNRPVLVRESDTIIFLPILENTAGGVEYTISLAQFEADGVTPVTNCTINAGTGTTIEGGHYTMTGGCQSVTFMFNDFPGSYSAI